MKQWINHNFESSSGTTEEWREFSRQFVRELKKQVKDTFEVAEINRGHFYMSGFLKHRETGKFVYFSTSDVRHFPNEWYENLLVRTAKHEKDYTGGANNWTTFPEIKESAIGLVN